MFRWATPSFAIENVRDAAVSVTIDLDGDDALSADYSLPPGERVVESNAFEVASEVTGRIAVDGDETDMLWPERACYRHGIALTEDGIRIGWIEPYGAPGDTKHDCYAGDEDMLWVSNEAEDRTIDLHIFDRCSEEPTIERFELIANESDRRHSVSTRGGKYDVEVDVLDGETEQYEYHEPCFSSRLLSRRMGTFDSQGV